MRILSVLLLGFPFLVPPFASAASFGDEYEAQMYFRPGNIVRENFDFTLFRQERRQRWGVRKVRGFSLGATEDVPLVPPVAGQETPAPPSFYEGTPHPQRREKPSFTLSQRERVRSYIRRGGCPEGLPMDYALACREALAAREEKHPSTRYVMRRAKNPKQDLRRVTKTFSLTDRLRMVAPRPRFQLFDRDSTRTLEDRAGD